MMFSAIALLLVSVSAQKCNLTPEILRNCTKKLTMNNRLSMCADGTDPDCEEICPNCIPRGFLMSLCTVRPTMPCPPAKMPIFAFNRSSGRPSLCPNCIPSPPANTCSREKAIACSKKIKDRDIGICAKEGEKPNKVDCCLSCLPKCNRSHFEACKEDYASLRDCVGDEEAKVSKCCRVCKVAVKKRKGVDKKCSREDFKKAIRMTPECGSGEKPVVDEGVLSCSPSCRRTESSFDLKDVIDCVKSKKECDGEEEPVVLPGERCSTCRWKGACAKTCNNAKVCVRARERDNIKKVVLTCVKLRKLRFRLRKRNLTLADAWAKLKALTKDEIPNVLREMVERFCERNSQAKRCQRFSDVVRDSLVCKKKQEKDGDIEIEVEVADGDMEIMSTRRRLAEDDTPAKFLEDAIEDNDIAGPEVLVEETDTSPPKDDSAASRKVALMSVLSIAAFLVI